MVGIFFGALVFMGLPHAAWALAVSPPVIEQEIGSGESVTKKITLYNENVEPIIISWELRAIDKAKHNETGAPTILPPSEVVSAPLSWIELPKKPLTLSVGAHTELPITIRVPKGTEPGGYYGALLVGSQMSGKKGEVNIIGKTAIIILLTVRGNIKTEGVVKEFSLLPHEVSWLDHQPEGFVVRIENTGTVHFKPNGTVIVRSMVGTEDRLAINPAERSVLPAWTRRFEIPWSRNKTSAGIFGEWQRFGLGRYTANLAVQLGTHVVMQQISYWVIPWRTLLALVVLVAVIILAHKRHTSHK